MNVWVPEKHQIERMLAEASERLRKAETVSEVADWLCDELGSIECHVYNRANDERKVHVGEDR